MISRRASLRRAEQAPLWDRSPLTERSSSFPEFGNLGETSPWVPHMSINLGIFRRFVACETPRPWSSAFGVMRVVIEATAIDLTGDCRSRRERLQMNGLSLELHGRSSLDSRRHCRAAKVLSVKLFFLATSGRRKKWQHQRRHPSIALPLTYPDGASAQLALWPHGQCSLPEDAVGGARTPPGHPLRLYRLYEQMSVPLTKSSSGMRSVKTISPSLPRALTCVGWVSSVAE